MSLVLWSIDELRKIVSLSDEVYNRAKKLGEEAGRKFYDGLMTVMSFKGSTETAIKYIEIQYNAAMPIAVLDERNLWNINTEFTAGLLRYVDPSIKIENIIREGKEDVSKFVGKKRLYLPGAWGEIASFYIMNEPIPKMVNLIYLFHLAAYVTTFTTATIPEIYTGSEDFLKLVSSVDKRDGAISFLTRLLRRRYIPEDQYAIAIEAIQRRRELGFSNLREVLGEHEARAYIADIIVKGIHGIVVRLQDMIEKYRSSEIPRSAVAALAGDLYSVIRGLDEIRSEYQDVLEKLNQILHSSGITIDPDKIRRVIEEITR